MGIGSLNAADVAILSAILAIMALVVRSMLRSGTHCSCGSSSCGGQCQCCKQLLTPTDIQLSDDQRAQLADIDRRAKGQG